MRNYSFVSLFNKNFRFTIIYSTLCEWLIVDISIVVVISTFFLYREPFIFIYIQMFWNSDIWLTNSLQLKHWVDLSTTCKVPFHYVTWNNVSFYQLVCSPFRFKFLPILTLNFTTWLVPHFRKSTSISTFMREICYVASEFYNAYIIRLVDLFIITISCGWYYIMALYIF